MTFFLLFATPSLAGTRGTIETSGDVGAVAVPLAAGIVSLCHRDRNGVLELIESYGTAIAVTLALIYR